MHAEKRRGSMDISDVGKEAMIHWNGPPIAMADILGEAALDRHFGGRSRFSSNFSFYLTFNRWHFFTLANKADSMVTKKLRMEQPSLPFFS